MKVEDLSETKSSISIFVNIIDLEWFISSHRSFRRQVRKFQNYSKKINGKKRTIIALDKDGDYLHKCQSNRADMI